MDIGTVQTINGVIVQKRPDANQIVTELSVQVSVDGTHWEMVDDGKVFKTGIKSKDTTNKKHYLNFAFPIKAKLVRLIVDKWEHHISMRAGVQIAGCGQGLA